MSKSTSNLSKELDVYGKTWIRINVDICVFSYCSEHRGALILFRIHRPDSWLEKVSSPWRRKNNPPCQKDPSNPCQWHHPFVCVTSCRCQFEVTKFLMEECRVDLSERDNKGRSACDLSLDHVDNPVTKYLCHFFYETGSNQPYLKGQDRTEAYIYYVRLTKDIMILISTEKTCYHQRIRHILYISNAFRMVLKTHNTFHWSTPMAMIYHGMTFSSAHKIAKMRN